MNIKHQALSLMFLLIIIGFSSCNTSKNVSELKYDAEGLYRDEAINSADTTSIANISIEKFFSDNKLVALIQEGLQNNLNVKIALERINQANTSVVMAKAAKWPTFGAIAQDEFSKYSSGDNGTKALGYNANALYLGFNASWEIDVWGKLNSTKKAKLATYLNSYESLALIRTNLVANIALGYYNLVALDEQLRITNETIGLLKESAETIRALKDAGLQNGAAVEQSNALLFSTQLSIYNIEKAIRQQENMLCLLLGKKPGVIDRNAINDESVPQELRCGVPAQMLARRPDVKSAELSFREAFELTNVAQAGLYPSVQISSAFLGYKGTDLSNLFSPKSIVANMVGSIAMPLFSQKRLKGNLAIAQSQQKAAVFNFESVVLAAGQEVSDIIYGFESSMKKNEWRSKQINSLSMAVNFNKELLKAGEANYIEVLSAQQNLLSAKLGKVNDNFEQLNYSVNLYKALGGGAR